MYRLFMFLLTATWCGLIYAQEPILQARMRPVGSVVNVEGIVLNGSELGPIRHIQDTSAGLALYPGGTAPVGFSQLTSGDRVRVTGVLARYKGLLEINPVLSFDLISSSNPLPAVVAKDPASLTDTDQSTIIQIDCAVFAPSRTGFAVGKNRFHTPDGFKSFVSFHDDHPMLNDEIPSGSNAITVIVSYEDGLGFLVRQPADIHPSACFHIEYTPVQSAIVQNGFDVQWKSSESGNGLYRIQRESGEMEYGVAGNTTTEHTGIVHGLLPAEFCQVSVGAVNGTGDTAWFPDIPMATQSESSGEIKIFFNRSINASFSNGSTPSGIGSAAMFSSVADLMSAATTTIDIAMYNSNRDDIIALLEEAEDRGVRVRMVADGLQNNGALDPLPSFPVFFRTGDGIMHHKFLVIDTHDPARAVVWTGSTNHSANQMNTDPNNAVVIHDQAIARAYQAEFNEMWGGTGAQPNLTLSRTGSAKEDDTPHLFQAGSVPVEVYFSPSDGTNTQILAEIEDADRTLDVGLLLLTRYDLTYAMTERAASDVDVRVIVNDYASSAAQIEVLEDGGVRTAYHDFNAIFHHKYAIIDEGMSDAVVLTGSHNWTTSATTWNDENTLIMHDPSIANIYRQEFEERWDELVSVDSDFISPLLTVLPNPSREWISIRSEYPLEDVMLTSMQGVLVDLPEISENHFDISGVPPGMYCLIVRQSHGMTRVPLTKVD